MGSKSMPKTNSIVQPFLRMIRYSDGYIIYCYVRCVTCMYIISVC